MIHIRFEGRSLDLLQNYQMPPLFRGVGGIDPLSKPELSSFKNFTFNNLPLGNGS